eukprot:403371438
MTLALESNAQMPNTTISITCAKNEVGISPLSQTSLQATGYCYACRALLPGCRSCSSTTMGQQTLISCDECEEGMYKYKLTKSVNAGPNQTISASINVCVPDCPSVNFQLINNPITQKCEFLGFYCKYGDFYNGCKQCSLQDQHYIAGNTGFITTINSTLVSAASFVNGNNFQFCTQCQYTEATVQTNQLSYFSKCQFKSKCDADLSLQMSNYCYECSLWQTPPSEYNCTKCWNQYTLNTSSLTLKTVGGQGGGGSSKTSCTSQSSACDNTVSNCKECSSTNTTQCIFCSQGFVLYNGQCLSVCPEKYFVEITQDDTTLLPKAASCSQCDTSCYSCIDGLSSSCTSCLNGQFLSISSVFTQSGTCMDKIAYTGSTKYISITSIRSASPSVVISQDEQTTSFDNIFDAVNQAYQIAAPYSGMTIEIQMNDPTYYILKKDLLKVYYNQKFKDFINPQFNLKITSTQAAKTTIYNKIGGMFQIQVPLSLSIENIIIDSSDSVVAQSTNSISCNGTADTYKNYFIPYHILIYQSTFKNIGTCGAIISNDYLNSGVSYSGDIQMQSISIGYYLTTQNAYKDSFTNIYYNKTYTNMARQSSNIIFHTSSFQNFHALKVLETNLTAVQDSARDHGLVLQLRDFKGNVHFESCTFKEIQQPVASAKFNVSAADKNKYEMENYIHYVIIEDARYLQFQRLINLVDTHETSTVYLKSNSFTNLSLTNALIKVKSLSSEYLVYTIIESNTFSNIIGLMGTGILHVEKGLYQSLSTAEQALQCGGGTHIQSNTFSEITGTESVDIGLMFFGCKDLSKATSGQSTSMEGLNDKFGADQNSLNSNLIGLQTSMQTLISGSTTAATISVYSGVVSDSFSTSYTINKYQTTLKYNTYYDCTLGVTILSNEHYYLGSLIATMGVMAIQLTGENYKNIGSFTQEYFNIIASQLDLSLTGQQKEFLSNTDNKGEFFRDRHTSFSSDQMMAVIGYFKNYVGTLNIGDTSGSTYNYFQNIVGMFNQHAIDTLSWLPGNTAYQYANKYYQGFCSPMFYLASNNISTLNFYNNVFQNNYAYYSDVQSTFVASIIEFDNTFKDQETTITFKNIKVYNNYQVYGYYYFNIEGTYITFTNVDVQNNGYHFTFLSNSYDSSYNYKYQAQPIFLINFEAQDSSSYLKITSCTFTNNTAENTPLFQLESSNSQSQNTFADYYLVTLDSCTFTSNIGTTSSIMLNQDSDLNFKLLFSSCTFKSNFATYGLIKVVSYLEMLDMLSCTFNTNTGTLAKLFYFTNNLIKYIEVNQIQFKTYFTKQIRKASIYETQVDTDDIQEYLLEDLSTYYLSSNPSLIVLSGQSNFNITDSYVKYIHYAYYGAFMTLESSSSANITNVNIKGVISAQDSSYLTVDNTIFVDNFAVEISVFKVSATSDIYVSGSQFYSNYVTSQNSIGQFIQSKGSSIKNSVIKSNYISSGGSSNTLQLISSTVVFEYLTFKDNQAQKNSAGIQVVLSNVYFNYSTFQNTNPSTAATKISGDFIYAISDSNIYINNTSFLNGRAKDGGAIYLLGYSNLTIENSHFNSCSVDSSGGAIYAASFDQFLIINSHFYKNKAGIQGDAIYSSNSLGYININSSSSFYSQASSNFLYLTSIESVNITNVTIYSSAKNESDSSKFSGIFLENIKTFRLIASTMKQLIANTTGGCLYITENSNNKQTANSVRYLIGNSTFVNCSALQGGAIFLSNVQGVMINDSSQFINNTAYISYLQDQTSYEYGVGGAINFYCQSGETKCTLSMEKVAFYQNYAQVKGGAFNWNYLEPTQKTLTFTNNTAKIYGNSISSVPKTLSLLTATQYQQSQERFATSSDQSLLMLRRSMDSSNSLYTLSSQKSGGNLDPLYFALLDKYSQIVATDLDSTLFLSAIQNSALQFASTFETVTSFGISNGAFEVSNVVFVGTPNSVQTFNITTDGIDFSIPDNAAYYSTSTSTSLSQIQQSAAVAINKQLYVTISLRDCEAGEALLSSGKCSDCAAGLYLLESPDEVVSCKECQSTVSYCYGRNEVYPRAGYWRSSIYSDNFISCRNDVACLGMNPPENNSLGACEVGYQGILCTDCQINYSRTGTYECSLCPDATSNSFKLFAIFVAVICALVFLIRSTIAGALEQKNYLSVFIRILSNHFQLLIITASFDFQWPTQLLEFFNSVKPASEATTQFLSVDCFIDTRSSNSDKGTIRAFYSKTIILALAPILVVIMCFVIWVIIFKIQDYKQKNKKDEITVKLEEFREQNELQRKNTIALHRFNTNQDIKNLGVNSSKEKLVSTSRSKGNISTQKQLKISHSDDVDEVHFDSKSHSGKTQKTSKPLYQLNNYTTTPRQNPNQIQTDGSDNQNHHLLTENEEEMLAQLIQEKKDRRQGRIISSVIIILFFIHPTITTQMFNAFNCQDIDGTQRLYEDLEVVCYIGNHKWIAYGVALPAIIIWSMGIPAYGFALIYMKRKELFTIVVKEKYGFLYNGYKEHSFYWEIFIMYRKITIIFIQVFLAQVGKVVQALVIIVVIVLCLVGNTFKQPFDNYHLNNLETLSLLSSALTIYCGIFYIAGEDLFYLSEDGKLFLFGIIVAVNVLFFLYWFLKFSDQLRITLKKKAPKVYFVLFLCCNKRRQEKEKIIDNYLIKHNHFLKSYENICDYLVENKNLYKNGYIPPEDQALQQIILKLTQFKTQIDREKNFQMLKNNPIEKLLMDKEMKTAINQYKLRPKQENDEQMQKIQGQKLSIDFGGNGENDIDINDEEQSSYYLDNQHQMTKKKLKDVYDFDYQSSYDNDNLEYEEIQPSSRFNNQFKNLLQNSKQLPQTQTNSALGQATIFTINELHGTSLTPDGQNYLQIPINKNVKNQKRGSKILLDMDQQYSNRSNVNKTKPSSGRRGTLVQQYAKIAPKEQFVKSNSLALSLSMPNIKDNMPTNYQISILNQNMVDDNNSNDVNVFLPTSKNSMITTADQNSQLKNSYIHLQNQQPDRDQQRKDQIKKNLQNYNTLLARQMHNQSLDYDQEEIQEGLAGGTVKNRKHNGKLIGSLEYSHQEQQITKNPQSLYQQRDNNGDKYVQDGVEDIDILHLSLDENSNDRLNIYSGQNEVNNLYYGGEEDDIQSSEKSQDLIENLENFRDALKDRNGSEAYDIKIQKRPQAKNGGGNTNNYMIGAIGGQSMKANRNASSKSLNRLGREAASQKQRGKIRDHKFKQRQLMKSGTEYSLEHDKNDQIQLDDMIGEDQNTDLLQKNQFKVDSGTIIQDEEEFDFEGEFNDQLDIQSDQFQNLAKNTSRQQNKQQLSTPDEYKFNIKEMSL